MRTKRGERVSQTPMPNDGSLSASDEVIREMDRRIRYVERLFFLAVKSAGGITISAHDLQGIDPLTLHTETNPMDGSVHFSVTDNVPKAG